MAISRTSTWSSARGLARATLVTLRPVGVAVLGVLAALGAVTNPRVSLLVGAALAALGWMYVRCLQHNPGTGLPRLPHPLSAAACLAVLPATAAGTTTLGLGPWGAAGAVSAVAAIVGSWGSSPAGRLPPAESGIDRTRDGASLSDLLGRLPVDVLCEEWGGTAGAVPDGEDAQARIRIREALISELHRRDPMGTTRWLTEAPDAPPDRYVRDTREGAT
jgi:hypothetical protein